MATNVTRILNAFEGGNNPGTTEAVKARVKYVKLDSGDTNYQDGTIVDWPEAFCEQIILRTGPAPGEAIINFSVPKSGTDQLGGIYPFTPYTIEGTTRTTPFTHNVFDSLGTGARKRPLGHMKVLIFLDDKNTDDRIEGEKLLFVGYITSLIAEVQEKSVSRFTVRAEDARYFMRKQPCEGTIQYNPTFKKFVYIRDHDAVFNEGNFPNRMSDPFGVAPNLSGADRAGNGARFLPCFIRVNHNRYDNDPTSPNFRKYIEDSELKTAIAAGRIGTERLELRASPGPFGGGFVDDRTLAERFTPGDVWNYYRYTYEDFRMRVVGARQSAEISIDEPTSQSSDEVPAMLTDEIQVMELWPSDDVSNSNTITGADWFEPRSVVGEFLSRTSELNGLTVETTGLGEFVATGMDRVSMFYELCRRVGNYTIAAEYMPPGLGGGFNKTGKMFFHPIRTTHAFGENKNLAYGKNPGSELAIVLPTDDDPTFMPDVINYRMESNYENTYSDIHVKAGKRIVDITFSTMGTVAYTDHLGYFHEIYAPADSAEWRPILALPTLMPAWNEVEQDAFLAIPDIQIAQMRFPKVFRDWILAFDVNLIDNLNITSQRGYRRFFERDRQIMNALVASVFEATTGIWRSDRVKLPHQVWRAFRGIRVAADKTTKYGSDADDKESRIDNIGNGPINRDDLFLAQPSFQILNDGGRIGIRLGVEARSNFEFFFDDPDATDGPSTSPWAWNGINEEDDPNGATVRARNHARPFEIFWTTAIELDEDLFDDRFVKKNGLRIAQDGPRMTLYRSAGNEYRQEIASNSMISLPYSGQDKISDPPQGNEFTLYQNGSDEVAARVDMLAARHLAVDFKAEVSTRSINLAVDAGSAIGELRKPRGANKGFEVVRVRTIASTVLHNFRDNFSTITLGTVR